MSAMNEKANAQSGAVASAIRGSSMIEKAEALGFYVVECIGPRECDREFYIFLRDGIKAAEERGDEKEAARLRAEIASIPLEEKWHDTIQNVVTTEGKNKALDVHLRGQAQITAWYIGIISSVSYSAVAATDVAAQINGTNGWKEAGPTNAPNYSQANRVAATFGTAASAGAISTSAVSAFSITSSGTVKGCFLASSNVKDGTTGTLYSAGLFTGGDKSGLQNGDTLNVSYTASI